MAFPLPVPVVLKPLVDGDFVKMNADPLAVLGSAVMMPRYDDITGGVVVGEMTPPVPEPVPFAPLVS